MYSLLLAIIYLSFISLGLPDSLLGAAWPSMYPQMEVPVSYSGIISMTIAVCTVISSLSGDRLTKKFGTGKVTAVSVGMTAAAIFGFSFSARFWQLFLWAIPYGLGAGSVDAALNNYVALNYASKHMSWLHCMWGVGTIIGPYVIGYALTSGGGWNAGYRVVGITQTVLTIIVFLSLPLWKKNTGAKAALNAEKNPAPVPAPEKTRALSLKQIIGMSGAKEVMAAFFCYCAIEQTTMLWAASYMTLHNGISAEDAAGFSSMFFIGITVGRAVNGFLMIKFTDTQMVRVGEIVIAIGAAAMLFSFANIMTLIGLILVGLGCAPVYPCIIHSTPEHFGAENSQALIGVQMASAYVGTSLMPPFFGFLSNYIGIAFLPVYLLVILLLMVFMHERLVRKTSRR